MILCVKSVSYTHLGNNVIKYVSDQAVVKIEIGSKIRLSADEFERLCKAFFEELERKCR